MLTTLRLWKPADPDESRPNPLTPTPTVLLTIRRIAVRFALLLALAAIVPLIAYGFVSILSLQRGTRESVIAGNMNVATRAAEEIRRYVAENADILDALAANLQDTGLTPDSRTGS